MTAWNDPKKWTGPQPAEGEVVRPIPGFPGYSATSNGRIWSHRKALWMKLRKSKDGYLVCRVRRGGKTIDLFVHRALGFAFLGLKEGQLTDHINRVRGDNRLENLRITDPGGNAMNSRIPKHNTTGHRNIRLLKGKWHVQIKKQRKKYTRSCSSLAGAIAWRNAKLKELHGEFASTELHSPQTCANVGDSRHSGTRSQGSQLSP